MPSIDPEPIEHRSKHIEPNQIFNRNFDRLRNRFKRSKFWKNQFFERKKKSILCKNSSKHSIL